MSSQILILFIRYPRLGHVKTRMTLPDFSSNPLSQQDTLSLYEAFLKDLIQRFCSVTQFDLLVRLGGTNPDELQHFQQRFSLKSSQIDRMPPEILDLGEMMENAFHHCFQKGYQRSVLIGSDIPQLTNERIQEAFDHLNNTSMVIGPDNDGGMYLVGYSQRLEVMREGIVWGQGIDLEEILRRCDQQSITYRLLPTEIDMDTSDDLLSWYSQVQQSSQEWEIQKNNCPNTMSFIRQWAKQFSQFG